MVVSNEQLRKHLGSGAISASEESKRILAFVPEAERILIRAIGAEMYDELKTQVAAENLTDKNATLFELVERALALYAYVYYLPFSIGSDGDSGLQESDTKTTQPTRMGVLNERKVATPEMAGNAIEDILHLLFFHADDYLAWKTSVAFQEANGLFVRTGMELGEALPPSGGSHRIYMCLRPWLADAERESVLPILTNDVLNDLKGKRKAGTLTDKEKALVGYVSRYVAWAAYFEALPHLVVQTTDNGLRVLSEFDGINNRNKPTDTQLEQLRLNIERKRDATRGALVGYLASEFGELGLTKRVVPNFKKVYTRVFSM